MINIGILGYGNLGKSLEKVVEADSQCNLVSIFSRRKLDAKKYVAIDQMQSYIDKIDVLLIAIGSFSDFNTMKQHFVGKFNTVDSFDNHNVIQEYKKCFEDSDRTAIVSVGWDPGIMSIMRALFSIFPSSQTATFWGKGISQGHSNALRTIDGVIDAVQFTVPKNQYLADAKAGNITTCDSTKMHKRLCYVAGEKQKQAEILQKIISMPSYFEPYETQVIFVEKDEVERLKQDMSHCGYVCSKNACGNLNFDLHTTSNPLLTAHTMLRYAKAMPKLIANGFKGALDCLDVAISYLVESKDMI